LSASRKPALALFTAMHTSATALSCPKRTFFISSSSVLSLFFLSS
jgi:hypothetical protein